MKAITFGLIIIVLFTVILLELGNPQWSPKIYIYQAYGRLCGVDIWGEFEQNIKPTPRFSGMWFDWDKTGNVSSVELYKNGKKEGISIYYNLYNPVAIVNYKCDKPKGIVVQFDGNGGVAAVSIYDDKYMVKSINLDLESMDSPDRSMQKSENTKQPKPEDNQDQSK